MVFYWLFSMIAQVVFSIASKIFVLIDDMSKYNFFSQGTINDFTSKVYVIIGVLMLFKLVISAVQYIVNPDMFDDKNKGLGAILKKSIIVVVLLAIVPSIFTFAMEVQGDIVDQIPKVIFGNQNYSMADASENISMTVMSSFLQVRNGKTATKVLNSVGDFSSVAMEGCDNNWLSLNLISGSECVHEPTVLITPIVGVFFVYILISLVIDVATRTIKLGIVQILAPIPITGYITDEKKLSNWAKTSVQIYVDLFIRLAVIYLIVYIIQVVLRDMFASTGYEALMNGMSGAINRTPDSLEIGLIKIVIIAALLLFAKNAPKFITELLGLKGAGEGFNDMFKRAGALPGALTNPFRTAVANTRNAWKNNGDMGESFGAKMRRALNASKHGLGGLAKGTLDAAQGFAAGDNWSKMNDRFHKSANKSNIRSSAAYMKRTSRMNADEQSQEIQDRRNELETYFRNQGIDINDAKNNSRGVATSAFQTYYSDLNSRISTLRQNIVNGMYAGDELVNKRNELANMVSEYDRLSTTEGKNEWIDTKTTELAYDRVAQDMVNRSRAQIITNNQEISTIRSEISSGHTASGRTLSAAEIESRRARVIELETMNDELNNVTIDSARNEILNKEKELNDIKATYYDKNDKINIKPEISNKTIVRGKIDQFFGGEGFTGKGYLDVADLLKSNRSALWSGEAMTKLQQNPHILKENNIEIQFSSPEYSSRSYTYSEILELKRKASIGQINETNIASTGFRSIGDLEAAFTDIEKKAATKYVNMASDGRINNSTVSEGVKRLIASISASNMPKYEKEKMISQLTSAPGDFLKVASDLQERLRTQGSRISSYNSGKKEN